MNRLTFFSSFHPVQLILQSCRVYLRIHESGYAVVEVGIFTSARRERERWKGDKLGVIESSGWVEDKMMYQVIG